MKIWKDLVKVEELNSANKNTIHQSLGIQFTEIGDDFLKASMPVDERTRNPVGILHGGASAVLAESLGSVASILVAGFQEKTCVGIEINASHLKSIPSGMIIGKATPLRLGKTLHVWTIKIFDAADPKEQPICHSRLTVMVKDRKNSGS